MFVFVVAFAFCTTAMASDIAFYVGQWNTDGWYDESQFDDVDTIITKTGHLFKDIQQFDDDQFDEFGAWVDKNTDDGEMDIIWLNGCMPSVLYPFPNLEPDGSRAEEWLDGGNMFINVGDWFGYVSYEGGSREPQNRPAGAANILDLAQGIIIFGDGTQLTVTPTGKEYLPSLNDPVKTDRPIALSAVEAPWEVAAIFASPGGTDDPTGEALADPVVLHNTETGGYVALINQAQDGPDGWIDDRGLTCAEFIGNWVISLIGDQPLAAAPNPQDGATDVIQPIILHWAPAEPTLQHDIYFGEDEQVLANATTESLGIYRGRQPAEMNTYHPDILELAKTYYWRIDEVDEDDPSSPWVGKVWSFTTADFLVVDDFESYNDLDPDNPECNRIFNTWMDGYSDPNNGSWVGYIEPPFVGRTIAHTGKQSMSFLYDNSGPAYYSEATANIADLVIDRDWTIEGVGVLSLWFGDVWPSDISDNTPERMYIALANSSGAPAVVYHDDPNATQITTWTEWRIDLQVFADKGVNLTDVDTVSIGFADKNNPQPGGSGVIYFDDIRLYHRKAIIYVDDDATGGSDGTSWANAYVYLQDALADANESERPVEIHVAQGTYTPDRGNGYVRGDKQAKFLLKSGVTIKGGFAGVRASNPNAWDHQAYKTVLSGDLSGNDERLLTNFVENSDHVIWCIEADASAVLDGFTITGGYATDRIGGGLLNYQANPTVKRCVFFDNYASQGGGMANRYSSPTVSECTFSGNLAPYGGGGMYNTDQSHPIVESCVFHDNWTWYLGGGGMYCGDSNPTVTQCLFIDNGAPFGGGMYNAAASPTITNCTFSGNSSDSWGGGMQNEAGAKPTVTNCILWGDIPDEIAFSGSATVTYSDVQGAWAGIGNIARDPKFADPEGRLSSGSPCIDAGNNDAVPSNITNDLDGNARIINGTVDMGAYEFGETTPPHPPSPPTDPLSEALDTPLRFTTGGNANWFAQTTTSYYAGDAAESGDISHGQDSWMQTTVSGKGTLKFYWKVSSEYDYDFLYFYIDGSLRDQISGSVNWQQKTYTISTLGSHTLEWRYVKDSGSDSGSDCGWVDKVEWLPIP
jgi:hypothetical protein